MGKIRETGGPTELDIGGIADGAFLKRSGTNIVGATPPPLNPLRPTGALYETFTRQGKATANVGIPLTTRLHLVAIELPSGLLVTSITFLSGTTAASIPLNQLFGLYDDNAGSSSGTARALLRGTVDDTTTAWAANTPKPLALTSTYTTTRAGFFYLGILVVATTPPTTICSSNAIVNTLAPITTGFADTAVTALPNPAIALTATNGAPYAWVS